MTGMYMYNACIHSQEEHTCTYYLALSYKKMYIDLFYKHTYM